MASPAKAAGRFVAAAAVALGTLTSTAAPASADEADEQQLAELYAPVMLLEVQDEACGPGEPYEPSDVDPLFDNPSVALRGPWTQQDLIRVAPDADRLSEGLDDYALDFPGNPLKPGCGYEQWADRVWADSDPTVYAHVATEDGYDDRIALQYWFYYPFNDFNNKHESDWEGIQLEFEAADAAAALGTEPVRLAYSQHLRPELSDWDDPKLETVDDTHPVVYVSTGSHSSHYSSAVFLLRSSTQGLGCDTTLGPNREVRPAVTLIPSDPDRAAEDLPWIGYEGHWGERESRSFFDSPTGPNAKTRWDKPFSWAEGGGDRSYAVPSGALFGVNATGFFCSVVGDASVVFLEFTNNPVPVLLGIAIVLFLLLWQVSRMSWRTAEPVPAARRRTFSQVVASSWSMLRTRPRVFAGIGLVVVTVALVLSVVHRFQLLISERDAQNAFSDLVMLLLTVVELGILVLALALAGSATTQAVADIDAGRDVTVRSAYRAALRRPLALLGALALWLVLLLGTSLPGFLLPLAVLLVVASSLFVPVLQLEHTSGAAALWRSWRLVRHQIVKVSALLVLGVLLATLLGGLISTGVLLAVQAPFALVDLLPGMLAALMAPYVALLLAYAYYDGIARERATAPTAPEAQSSR